MELDKERDLSAVRDSAPSGLRSAACYRDVPAIEVSHEWIKVTCRKCLLMKVDKPRVRMKGINCGKINIYTRTETKLKDEVTCLICRGIMK